MIGDDHPTIVEHGPMTINRTDNIEDNTMVIRTEQVVSLKMCSDTVSQQDAQKSCAATTEGHRFPLGDHGTCTRCGLSVEVKE